MGKPNPYQSPVSERSGGEPSKLSPATHHVLATANLMLLGVQTLLWLVFCSRLLSIAYGLIKPRLYEYVYDAKVIVSDTYYYDCVAMPALIAGLIGAVALGLGQVWRRVKKRMAPSSASV